MGSVERKTLRRSLKIEGVGLHTGETCEIEIHPDDTSGRAVFIKNREKIPASVFYAFSEGNFTGLKSSNASILTVEHLLSAFFSYGISDCYVELRKGREIPDPDGCSLPFCEFIEESGIYSFHFRERIVTPVHIMFTTENRIYEALPSEELKIECTISFPHKLIGSQKYSFLLRNSLYKKEIAPARTFTTLEEVEKLRREGKGKGGDLKRVLVFSEDNIINPGILKWADEPVRHKILDFLGDAYLFSPFLRGEFILHSPGHRANISFFINLKVEEIK